MKAKRILFPVDLTDFSPQIVPQVISVAAKPGAEIHLVAVIPPAAHGIDFTELHSDRQLFEAVGLEHYERKLREFVDESFVSYRNVKRTLLHGDPAEEIIRYIYSAGIDLVIMATHRKTGLGRVLLGSVADEVIKRSPVPVMSINPEEKELGWRVSKVDPGDELRLRPNWGE